MNEQTENSEEWPPSPVRSLPTLALGAQLPSPGNRGCLWGERPFPNAVHVTAPSPGQRQGSGWRGAGLRLPRAQSCGCSCPRPSDSSPAQSSWARPGSEGSGAVPGDSAALGRGAGSVRASPTGAPDPESFPQVWAGGTAGREGEEAASVWGPSFCCPPRCWPGGPRETRELATHAWRGPGLGKPFKPSGALNTA